MRATRFVLMVVAVAFAVWAAWALVEAEAGPAAERQPVRTAPVPEPKSEGFHATVGDRPSELPPVPASAPSATEPLQAAPVVQPIEGLLVRTVDARGVRLPGITVVVASSPDDDWHRRETTGADGTAWLGCSAGRYDVHASDSAAESRLGNAWRKVEVAESEPTEVTLTLPDATSRLEVVVRDNSGRPLEGLRLRADGPGPNAACGDRHTDAAGVAVWEPVAAGHWGVVIRGIPASLGVVEPADSKARIEVAAGATASGEFVCPRKGTLVVRLEHDSLAAEIVHVRAIADRSQISRGLVAIEPRDSPWEWSWMAPEGTYVVTAEWFADSEHWSRAQLVDVASGGQSVVTIKALQCQARLMGHVRDAAGQPVRGVIVWATIYESLDGRDWTARKLELLTEKTATSAEDGSWALAVPIGRVGHLRMDTVAAHDRYLDRYAPRLEIIDYTRPVELIVSPGYGVEAGLEGEAAALAGDDDVSLLIMRHEELEPVASWIAKREGDGSFRFDHVGAGRYTAVLRRSNTDLTQPVRFEIAPGFREGETVPITLTVTE